MTHNYFSLVRSDPHRAFLVEEKCSHSVELAFCYKGPELATTWLHKRTCRKAVEKEVQPGCPRGSAERLHKRKCRKAVQTRGSAARLYKRRCCQAVELAFYYKRKEPQFRSFFYRMAVLHYSLDAPPLVQPGCSVVPSSYTWRVVLQPGWASSGTVRL